MGGDRSVLWGVFSGGAIGIGIGLNEFFKFMTSYKSMGIQERLGYILELFKN